MSGSEKTMREDLTDVLNEYYGKDGYESRKAEILDFLDSMGMEVLHVLNEHIETEYNLN